MDHRPSYFRCYLFLLFGITLFTSTLGIAKEETISQPPQTTEEPFPWLVGPLLTPSAHVVPKGHINYEPYVYASTTFATYDKSWHSHNLPENIYTVYTQQLLQIGMPANMDFTLVPQFAWNHTHGASNWVLNDMVYGFDFQIYRRGKHSPWPSVKLALRGNFPLGKYQKLNPNKLGTDIGGSGSWTPAVSLDMSRLFWFGGHQFLALRWSVGYAFPTAVHVKGFNAYGGGHHTHGKVYPGQSLSTFIGMEYTWTQRWAFAFDFAYIHNNKTRFKGHKGITRGISNSVGGPSSEQFSIAPAFEYNWSAYVGMIAGVWFTVGGRNTTDFAQGIVAINIYK